MMWSNRHEITPTEVLEGNIIKSLPRPQLHALTTDIHTFRSQTSTKLLDFRFSDVSEERLRLQGQRVNQVNN